MVSIKPLKFEILFPVWGCIIQGGHLNPAVTLALAVSRRFEWRKLPAYWLAQYIGAVTASGTVLGVYYGKLK